MARTPEEQLRFDQLSGLVQRIHMWCDSEKVGPHEMVQIFNMGIAAFYAYRYSNAHPDETLLALEDCFARKVGIYDGV